MTMQQLVSLIEIHQALGGQLANDGIPLHYGDLAAEYQAALTTAVIMDRSHEGRILLSGRDRFELIQRISTNDVLTLAEGEGRPTLFTNPNGRILERALVYRWGENALLISEPGRAESLKNYLQRNVFFNDHVQVVDHSGGTHLFTLHGSAATEVLVKLFGREPAGEIAFQDAHLFVARQKPLVGDRWVIVTPKSEAAALWTALLNAGEEFGLRAAGSLTYNALRIRAGRPGAGRELSSEYIPLEIGLWDEVNFRKGCYTGQEIIARMESRRKLARTILQVRLDQAVDAPAELHLQDRKIGTLTSSVVTPAGEALGIAVVKVGAAKVGAIYQTANGIRAEATAFAGVQPAIEEEDNL
jgi:tRNA-modifying protein YgfZ